MKEIILFNIEKFAKTSEETERLCFVISITGLSIYKTTEKMMMMMISVDIDITDQIFCVHQILGKNANTAGENITYL